MKYCTFMRLNEGGEKADVLLAAARGESGPGVRFEVDAAGFASVARSPFAYWVSDRIRQLFQDCPALESDGRVARPTNGLTDNGRWIRLAWEVSNRQRWRIHAKGGAFSRFWSDLHLVIGWDASQDSYPGYLGTAHRPDVRPASRQYFFRPGLTWSYRSQKGFSMRALPRGVIFGAKGPSCFRDDDDETELAKMLAVVNSSVFRHLLAMQMAFGSYEAGVIQRTPLPRCDLPAELGQSSLRAWSLRRSLDTAVETSVAFCLPGVLQFRSSTIEGSVSEWADRVISVNGESVELQRLIDSTCMQLYGIHHDDREAIDDIRLTTADEADGDDGGDGDDETDEGSDQAIENVPLTAQLLAWTLGISFGRFDLRLATGERPLPPEPDPFDPLPACSPGMLTGDDGLPLSAPPPNYAIAFPTDGILVDDPGHDRDIVARIHQVFTVLFADHADDRLQEAVSILDPSAKDLRPWLRRTFFEEHIQRYSKSRRKAPIYWRLGTPSGSYSVWIYLHRFNKDTLHRVLNDHVAPKLRYESNKLDSLRSEAGPSPTPSQRKTLDAQETFVDELRGFSDEVQRVAPLWDPDLDDGVVINASFLHRLFAHTRAWQKECESHWQKLQKGEYDWAHLAMRLWPERVVPKCTEDRSLAIAHGLEDVLWLEGTDGKWRPQHVTDAEIAALVQERTSTAVKDALRRMGETPEPVAARKVRAAAPTGEPRSPRKAKASSEPTAIQVGLGLPDDPTPAELDAVRAALNAAEDGLAKADLLAGCGLDEGAGAAALAALVQTGEVVKIGAGRGTRYRLGGEG